MAEPLKNQFGADIPRNIAGMIRAVSTAFPSEAFTRNVMDGYEPLDLMQRGWKIAHALRVHLPQDYAEAVQILLASLGPKLEKTDGMGMAPFLYLPHVLFVAEYGLGHFELSMLAQYELTQRFTAEFSIRPYLEKHRDATLEMLKEWALDPSVHVRRLVSEGTRPRLPWAPRLREFQADPQPVLELLELLKDDAEPYVRRSVANNLNDIGKDHPDLLAETARRWLYDAPEERRRLVRHALRSAIKRGEAGALAALGFDGAAVASICGADISPPVARLGDAVAITFDLHNTAPHVQQLLVDFRIHFVKANGKTSPKVFKLKTVSLAPGEVLRLGKTVSLAAMTTRRHYPGTHRVDVVLNGAARPLGSFELLAE